MNLFVFDCSALEEPQNISKYELIRQGAITSLDTTLIDYTWHTQVLSLNCTQPLYMGYIMNYISIDVYKPFPQIMDIWKVFDKNVWFCIITTFVVIIILDTLINFKNNFKISIELLLNKFWIYFKPLLLIGESLGVCNYLYLLWVLSITPLVHILQNDLTAQMVNRDVMNVDTIDDLFDDRLEVYADPYIFEDFNEPDYYSRFEPTFKQKFTKMLKILRKMDSGQFMYNTMAKVAEGDVYESVMNIVFITSEMFMETIKALLDFIIPCHIGRPDLPIYLTTLCYEPNFQYTHHAYIT